MERPWGRAPAPVRPVRPVRPASCKAFEPQGGLVARYTGKGPGRSVQRIRCTERVSGPGALVLARAYCLLKTEKN